MGRGESRLTIPLMNGWDYLSTVYVIRYLVRFLISRSLLDAARDQEGPIWSKRESQVLHMSSDDVEGFNISIDTQSITSKSRNALPDL